MHHTKIIKIIFVTLISLIAFQSVLAQRLPAGFVPPALHPEGVTLSIQKISEHVYALQSSRPPADNAGFIVGDKGVLVIDAHIDANMANQIISAVRKVTDKPILYLVNTNGHADHTFGNYAFPQETKIIAQKLTKQMMSPDIDQRKKGSLGMVKGDMSVFEHTKSRMPDIVFDDYMEIDLGGVMVELYHFGAGNTAGDTVVYLPSVKTAWTGNLVLGEGSLPFLLIGDTDSYKQTINRFSSELEIDTIIPGHGIPTTAAIFNRYVDYLDNLKEIIISAHNNDQTLDSTIANNPLVERFAVPDGLSSTDFYRGLHPFNIQKIYLEKKE